MTLWLTALPLERGAYDRWQVLENHIGWVAEISDATLVAAIGDKAQRLDAYRSTGSASVELLLVADHTQASGMLSFDPSLHPTIDSRGFSAVHLLIYPLAVHRIA